jgi:hypothetical protein
MVDAPQPQPQSDSARAPAGQRFYDNIFLMLALGIVIMAIVYTGWGMYEIMTLPTSRLP